MLEASLAELASLFRQYDEPDLAKWIDRTVQGDPATLPERVLEMFTHGMGGLMDRDLYSEGELDRAATEHRNALAGRVYEEARARLRLSVALLATMAAAAAASSTWPTHDGPCARRVPEMSPDRRQQPTVATNSNL